MNPKWNILFQGGSGGGPPPEIILASEVANGAFQCHFGSLYSNTSTPSPLKKILFRFTLISRMVLGVGKKSEIRLKSENFDPCKVILLGSGHYFRQGGGIPKIVHTKNVPPSTIVNHVFVPLPTQLCIPGGDSLHKPTDGLGVFLGGRSDSKYFSRLPQYSRYFFKNSSISRVDQLYQDWNKILFKMP